MRLFKILLCSLFLNAASACVIPQPPNPTPVPPPVVTNRAVAVFVYDQQWKPVQGATCQIQTSASAWLNGDAASNKDGYILWSVVSSFLTDTQLQCQATNFASFSEHRQLETAGDEYLDPAQMFRTHVDPSIFTLDQLSKIRGSMWTARLNVPYGPRPNQDSNILATVFYGLYDAPTRTRMLDGLLSRSYTHAVSGPITGNDCYHSLYPCRQGLPTQAQWDAFLDEVQEWWDRGIVPVYFAKPDGWEQPGFADAMNSLDAFYSQDRAQKLLRVVIYPGWEPSGSKYGWSNATYVAWVKRGAQVFPNALLGLHLVSDLDAPTGQNDDQTFPPGQGNALSWHNVAPYIDFFADQLGGYIEQGSEVPTQNFLDESCKHMDRVKRGFQQGYAGWPTIGRRGVPILHIAAEYAAYGDFWSNWAEKYSLQLGDWFMQCGADGYLDGGTVPVR